MKKLLTFSVMAVLAAGFIFAQTSSLQEPNPEDVGADSAMASLREVSLDKFEREGSWKVHISSDDGTIAARLFEGAPSMKEPLAEDEGKEDEDKMVYHYLLLQAGAFGSKQIWIENNKWKNNTFRSYWLPTETSNRRSPVNPMMPMPNTLYNRVEAIVEQLSGIITASRESVFDAVYRIDEERNKGNKNIIIYIDPPYANTTGYKETFDIYSLEGQIWSTSPIYISEGYKMQGASESYLLSVGRTKGNISGEAKKKPTEEWLNRFNLI